MYPRLQIPLLGMISGQIAFMIVAILAFLFGAPLIHNGAILASGCLGLLFYAFFPVVVLGATFFPSLTNEIILGLAKILAHLRIIKDPHSFTNKIQSSTKQYTDCVKVIIKKRHLSLKVMTLSFLYVFCTYSIPFFVLLTFGGEINFIACFITTLAIASTIYFIPTPGNTGAAEGSFFVVFSSLTSGFIFGHAILSLLSIVTSSSTRSPPLCMSINEPLGRNLLCYTINKGNTMYSQPSQHSSCIT